VTGVTCDESDATKSVSDIFAKISRDRRKSDKPGSTPQSILKKPDLDGDSDKKLKRRIR
jgi:hypothetical protein